MTTSSNGSIPHGMGLDNADSNIAKTISHVGGHPVSSRIISPASIGAPDADQEGVQQVDAAPNLLFNDSAADAIDIPAAAQLEDSAASSIMEQD